MQRKIDGWWYTLKIKINLSLKAFMKRLDENAKELDTISDVRSMFKEAVDVQMCDCYKPVEERKKE